MLAIYQKLMYYYGDYLAKKVLNEKISISEVPRHLRVSRNIFYIYAFRVFRYKQDVAISPFLLLADDINFETDQTVKKRHIKALENYRELNAQNELMGQGYAPHLQGEHS